MTKLVEKGKGLIQIIGGDYSVRTDYKDDLY